MPAAVVTLKSTQNQQDLTIHRPSTGLSLQGTLQVPGDKSISHRALMLGALAQGETRIEGLLLGEDPRSTASCFRDMGAEISELNADAVIVKGIGLGQLQEPLDVLNAGNSGTTLRLMLGILASHPGRFFTVTGDNSLRSRPMSRVVKPLQQMGAKIWGRAENTLAPLAIQGQPLQPIHYHSPIASAQVKSCILLAGLMVEGQTTVVPGDISSAAFWLVAGAIVPDSELLVEKVGVNPTRTGILEALAMMGANIQLENQRVIAGEPVADVRVRHGQLKGCTIAGDLIPRLIDEIPILAVAAAFAEGTTTIRDAAELRVKESDRLAVMASQLSHMGARVTELPDGLEITGGTPLIGTEVDCHTDHRIAMSLAIAALNATGTTTIHGAEAAAISYPDFTATLLRLCN